jgi:hypothetical protein
MGGGSDELTADSSQKDTSGYPPYSSNEKEDFLEDDKPEDDDEIW